jgi:hypothetical protein
MENNAPHLSVKQVGVVPVEAYERAAVEGDLVGERAPVLAAASGERYALVEPEQRPPRWRFVFDHDLDVRQVFAQIRRERVDCVLCVLLEPLGRVAVIACHSASKPGAAPNAESRLQSSVLRSVFSCRPDEQAEDDHCGHDHHKYENDRGRNAHTDILAATAKHGQRGSLRCVVGARRIPS